MKRQLFARVASSFLIPHRISDISDILLFQILQNFSFLFSYFLMLLLNIDRPWRFLINLSVNVTVDILINSNTIVFGQISSGKDLYHIKANQLIYGADN